MLYVRGYVLSNVKNVCSFFAEFISRNMRLPIERTSNVVSLYPVLTLTLYFKKGLDEKVS